MELKNFIDFAYSMINMDEVKSGKFVLPKEITFSLDEITHEYIHKEVKNEKKDFNYESLNQPFEINILNIDFKFEIN